MIDPCYERNSLQPHFLFAKHAIFSICPQQEKMDGPNPAFNLRFVNQVFTGRALSRAQNKTTFH